jgi:hypothetical protein
MKNLVLIFFLFFLFACKVTDQLAIVGYDTIENKTDTIIRLKCIPMKDSYAKNVDIWINVNEKKVISIAGSGVHNGGFSPSQFDSAYIYYKNKILVISRPTTYIDEKSLLYDKCYTLTSISTDENFTYKYCNFVIDNEYINQLLKK